MDDIQNDYSKRVMSVFLQELPEDVRLDLAHVVPTLGPSLGLGEPLGSSASQHTLVRQAKEALTFLLVVIEGYRSALQTIDGRLRLGDTLLVIAEIATAAAGCSILTALAGQAQFWGKMVAGGLSFLGGILVIISKALTRVPGSSSLVDARATLSSDLCDAVLLQRRILLTLRDQREGDWDENLREVLEKAEDRIVEFLKSAAKILSPATDGGFHRMVSKQADILRAEIKYLDSGSTAEEDPLIYPSLEPVEDQPAQV